MVTPRVMANSRKSRPTTSLMNRSGISTAISETVSEMIVNPICSAPRSAASQRRLPLLDVAGDVLDHDDGVVHDEAGRDGERHQRQVVQAEPQEVHDPERADQRERHRDAGDERWRPALRRKRKITSTTSATASISSNLHVPHRGADGRRAIGEHRDLDRGGQRADQLRQEPFHAVHDLDDVRARLALDVEDHRGDVVPPGRLLHVLGVVDHLGDVGQADGSAVPVRDDERPVVAGSRGADRSRRSPAPAGARRTRPWPG